MAFWSSWSDGKKWIMGILSALIIAAIIGGASRLLRPGDGPQPEDGLNESSAVAGSQGQAPLPISLRITSPAPGAVVESGAAVSFTSSFEDLGHYIIVIPLRSPDRYVVDGPLHISADQPTSGRARFGNEAAGIGEQFAIQVIATKTPLVEGVLAQLPEDAKLSSQVIVYRAR
jgi:hypothetical protein